MSSKIYSSEEFGLKFGTTGTGVVVPAADGLILTIAFFLDFPESGLGAAVDLDSGFVSRAVYLVAVALGWLGNCEDG
jgi:hypothetical protein